MTKLEATEPQPRKTKTVTALFDHCQTVYDEMKTQSREETLGEDLVTIYEGHTSKLFQQLGLAVPYYTSVLGKLKDMGCIELLRRGGGGAPSRWILYKKPEEKDFVEALTLAKPKRGKTAMLEQQVRDLQRRVDALEVILSA